MRSLKGTASLVGPEESGVEAVVAATAIAIASLLLVLELTFRHVHALVRETKQDGSHCTISAHAKLRGCGEVRVEITPPEPKRRARHS